MKKYVALHCMSGTVPMNKVLGVFTKDYEAKASCEHQAYLINRHEGVDPDEFGIEEWEVYGDVLHADIVNDWFEVHTVDIDFERNA